MGETLVEPQNSRGFYTAVTRKALFVVLVGGERFGFRRYADR
jgi:hypothetical protein